MIVVDTNVLLYFILPGEWTAASRRAWKDDPEWAAPPLWRSELRDVLAGYMRRGHLTLALALEGLAAATELIGGREFEPDTARVLDLVDGSRSSAYNCEFVAVAEKLESRLLTTDRGILRDFPEIALPLSTLARGG